MIGIITALPAEAAVADRIEDVEVVCGGIGPAHAAARARRLIAGGATGLVSLGIAGGLKPDYWPGIVVIARQVIAADGTILDTDSAWRQRLIAALIGDDLVVEGRLFGSDRLIARRSDKSLCFQKTGAVAVDMESHAVAAVAQAADIPFVAVRAVADPADRTVPDVIALAVDADGTVRRARIIAAALRRPWTAPGLIRLGVDGRRALAALRRVVALIGPGFAGRAVTHQGRQV